MSCFFYGLFAFLSLWGIGNLLFILKVSFFSLWGICNLLFILKVLFFPPSISFLSSGDSQFISHCVCPSLSKVLKLWLKVCVCVFFSYLWIVAYGYLKARIICKCVPLIDFGKVFHQRQLLLMPALNRFAWQLGIFFPCNLKYFVMFYVSMNQVWVKILDSNWFNFVLFSFWRSLSVSGFLFHVHSKPRWIPVLPSHDTVT